MDAVGEKPLIPREINQLSQTMISEGKIDTPTTFSYLQSSTNLQSAAVDPAKCDPALRILADVLRLCEMENKAIEGGFGHSWSPLVSSTIIWFIGMFTNSYFYIDASYYCPLGQVYCDLLIPSAPSGPASNWCMEFILRKVAWNLHNYHHDEDVVEESIRLFLDIVNVRNQKLQHIMDLPSFQNLIHMRDLKLNSKVKRSVYKGENLRSLTIYNLLNDFTLSGLIMASNAFTNIEQRQECLRHLIEPIGNGFDAVVMEAQQSPHDTAVRERLKVVLDEMTGVAQGINGQTFPLVYSLLRDRFNKLPDMMMLWRNYLDIQCAILNVLIEMATVQMATNANAAEMARNFYDVCLRAMRCYIEQQTQRLDKIYSDEEEQPEDVLLIVELFKKLTIQYIFEPAGEFFKKFL